MVVRGLRCGGDAVREVASHVSGGATGTRERCAGKVVPQRHPADHVPAAERERVGWGLHGLHEGRTTLGCFVQFDAKGRKKERTDNPREG